MALRKQIQLHFNPSLNSLIFYRDLAVQKTRTEIQNVEETTPQPLITLLFITSKNIKYNAGCNANKYQNNKQQRNPQKQKSNEITPSVSPV